MCFKYLRNIKTIKKGAAVAEWLRLCKTAITWHRSLSAILPLFWRHYIAELHRLCREDCRNVLWRHERCDGFPRIMSCALQNMQFSRYFTTKFNIFSLNLTGESDFFFNLLVRTTNFLWVVLIGFEWSDFLLGWIIWFDNFHFAVICTQMSSQTLPFYTFLSIWKSLYFMKHDPEDNIFYSDRHFYN